MKKYNRKESICHPGRPQNAKGLCTTCYAKWMRQNNSRYREKARAYGRKRYYKNRKAILAVSKGYYGRHREHMREVAYQHQIKKKFGALAGAKYQELFRDQRGLCGICRKPPQVNRRLGLDHCHTTGAIRGLLCDSCNRGIGYLKDDAELLETAIFYLKGMLWKKQKQTAL